MLYELTDAQVKQLKIIIAECNIKGASAPAIVELLSAMGKPIKKEKKEGE